MKEFRTKPLTLVGTPIGNLGDISPRAQTALASADVIACEDTRRAGQLLRLLGIKAPKLMAFHKDNEHERTEAVVGLIRQGQAVVLMSDSGMPGISDPGAPLVAAARRAGLAVEVIPGPTAVATAVAGSGFAGGFSFVGFPPRKSGELRRMLETLSPRPEIQVFYESPNRVQATVNAMCEIWGNREAWLVRELTKMHEEWIGPDLQTISATLAARGDVKGECVLVVSGVTEAELQDKRPEIDDKSIEIRLKNGEHVKTLANWVASETGISKKDAYVRVQSLKK